MNLKSKSIKNDMIRNFGALFLAITLIFSIVFYKEARESNIDNTLDIMNEISYQASNLVVSKITQEIIRGTAVANDPIIRDVNASIEDKKKVLANNMNLYGHLNIGMADVNGKMTLPTGEVVDVSNGKVFKNTIAGNITVSDPYISSRTGEMIISYGIPVKDVNGKVFSIIEYAR
ncbi:MAG: PDC sensor domain-containing protein, partial [Clostridium sp.]